MSNLQNLVNKNLVLVEKRRANGGSKHVHFKICDQCVYKLTLVSVYKFSLYMFNLCMFSE